MHDSFKRILTGTIIFVLTLITAVIGYTLFGWTLLDSIYMVVITIFGVGYGEVHPLETPPEKIFTMMVIIAGTTSAVYIVGGFVQMVAEGEINKALDTHRLDREIKGLENHAIICGFGRMGQIMVQQLVKDRQKFVIIDRESDRVAKAEQLGYLATMGNATDENLLISVGIKKARVLATVLPDDAANVFITLTARGLNQNLIILSRGELPSTEKKLKLAGADRVVLPAIIGGMRMANLITRPTSTDFLKSKSDRHYLDELLSQINIQIDELVIQKSSALANKSVGHIEVRGKGTFIIVAIRREDKTVIKNPDRSVMLRPGDTVIVMGHHGDIPQFAQFNELKSKMRYRGSSIG
ncbi:potassium channel protein [Pleurocapsa sp. CCALA 161]|uniref:potassium channel family protein n=1 Tax=Pleurocapsa sp. CCALA 161 TaxID=2107688 RepID=UPI000D06E6C3|nr:potassium channel protein [Pleurocapsa sp. CCALA 161]PSB10722.1 potassium channel protein [Pleurocapsa sp. CCALA 161]